MPDVREDAEQDVMSDLLMDEFGVHTLEELEAQESGSSEVHETEEENEAVEPAEEAQSTDTDEGESETSEPQDGPARIALQKLALSFDDKVSQPGADGKPDDASAAKDVKETEKAKAPESAPVSAPALVDYNGLQLPETVKIGGKTFKPSELLESFDEDTQALVMAISQATANRLLNESSGKDEYVPRAELNRFDSEVTQLRNEVQRISFLSDVQMRTSHKDAMAIVGTPEWTEYYNSLPPAMRRLASSYDIKDADALFSDYKEQMALKSRANKPDPQKSVSNTLKKTSMRPGKQKPARVPDSELSDEEVWASAVEQYGRR